MNMTNDTMREGLKAKSEAFKNWLVRYSLSLIHI